MKVAILMSTYNGEQYIKEQIDSILSQQVDTEIDIELWVRDDGSTDGTHEILKSYESANQLHWYTGQNLGPTHSFLDLLNHCTGYDYYAFADQDDVWMPKKIAAGIGQLSGREKPTLYVANAELVDIELKSFGRNVYEHYPRTDFHTLICAGGLLGCAMIFNRALAEKLQNKPIPNEIIMHDFYTAAVCVALEGEIIFDSNPYMKYRQHGNNAVGVPVGFWNTLRQRWKDMTTRYKVSISDQTREILEIYQNDVVSEKKEWLSHVAEYKRSFWSRVLLACSRKTKYSSMNMAIKIRIAILLGNL